MKPSNEYIFVQIPSYKDTQLVATIEDLLYNASYKNRLNICICFQHAPGEILPDSITQLKNIKIIPVPYQQSKGVNWARNLLQQEWNGEQYSLLIDSHMRFVKGWDTKLIKMMKVLKNEKISKPILSCLPPPFYNPDTFPLDRLDYPLKIYPKEYTFNLLTRFEGMPLPLYKWLKKPIQAEFIALGFLFTEGYFNTEIPFDPAIYFFGDDITTGLRAYCHGYDFFHPHRIVAWHLYDRKTRIPHWEDHQDWFEQDRKSYERVQRILQGEIFDRFPIGKERSIASYEAYTGYRLIQHESQN